jgi:hypothetical protein
MTQKGPGPAVLRIVELLKIHSPCGCKELRPHVTAGESANLSNNLKRACSYGLAVEMKQSGGAALFAVAPPPKEATKQPRRVPPKPLIREGIATFWQPVPPWPCKKAIPVAGGT